MVPAGVARLDPPPRQHDSRCNFAPAKADRIPHDQNVPEFGPILRQMVCRAILTVLVTPTGVIVFWNR